MTPDVVRAHSAQHDTSAALAELTPHLAGVEPSLVLFFCSSNHDGLHIQRELQALAPSATVAGCTTAGELSDRAMSDGGVVLVALSRNKVKRCAAVITDYEGKDVETEVLGAARILEQRLQVSLRELSPDNWVGILLNEGMHRLEDDVVDVVGHVAPLLSFVGGSAGDNLKSVECTVFAEGRKSSIGSVLVLLELAVPYVVIKSCSLEATQTKVQITRVHQRVVYEIDGQPALARYAQIVGAKPDELGPRVFMANPLGVMIDGEPWVRAPAVCLPDGGIMFGARIIEGSELYLLRSTDLVADTRRALERGAAQLGKTPDIGILFNCAHRAIEIQVRQIQREFHEAISAFPVVGFHSYGENYLTQLNQTMVGLLLG